MDEEKLNRGPYVLHSDGTMSDSDIWEAEMDPEVELKYDQYLYIRELNAAAKKELARREIQKLL